MRDLDDQDWTLRQRPTLTHTPPANDPDDARETLAALAPSPEARRFTDIIAWQANPQHYPTALIGDATTWLKGYAAREGHTLQLDLGDYAVAVAVLCRRDGALYGDGTAPSGALACVVSALCGAGVTLGIGLLGYWLAH